MSDVTFPCPKCKSLISIGSEVSGMQARCPNCEAVVLIPHLTPYKPADIGENEPAVKEAIAICVEPYRNKVLEYQANLKKITEEYNSNISELRDSERTALSLQKELWELEAEIHELKETAGGDRMGPATGEDLMASAKEDVAGIRKELSDLTAAYDALKQEQTVKAAEPAQKGEADAARQKQIKELEAARKKLEKALADEQKLSNRLEQEKGKLEEKKTTAETNAKEQGKRVKELEKALKDREKEAEKLQAAAATHTEKLKEADLRFKDAVQSKKDELKTLRDQFKLEQGVLQDSLELIESKADDRQKKILTLETQLADAQSMQEGASKAQAQEAEQRTKLEQELESLRAEKAAADQKIHTLQAEGQSNQQALQSAVHELEAQLGSLQESISGYTRREEELSRGTATLEEQVRTTQSHLETLVQNHKATTAALRKQLEQASISQSVQQELDAKLQHQQEEIETLTRARDNVKQQYEEALANMQDQELDLQSTRNQMESLQQEAENARALSEKLDQIEYHAAENASRNESYRNLIMELEEENKSLNHKLRDTDSMEAEVKRLRSELEQAVAAQQAQPEAPAASAPLANADPGQETMSNRAIKQLEIKMRQITRENEQLKNNINTLRENLRAIMTAKQ